MNQSWKKRIGIFVVAAYAALTHYCLLYAAVTGNMCHASVLFSDFRRMDKQTHDGTAHKQDCHSTPSSHDSSSHNEKSSGQESPCCVKVFQNVPGLLPGQEHPLASPTLAYLPAEIVIEAMNPTPTLGSRCEERGPPTPSAQPSFLSHRSPRAPPLLASL